MPLNMTLRNGEKANAISCLLYKMKSEPPFCSQDTRLISQKVIKACKYSLGTLPHIPLSGPHLYLVLLFCYPKHSLVSSASFHLCINTHPLWSAHVCSRTKNILIFCYLLFWGGSHPKVLRNYSQVSTWRGTPEGAGIKLESPTGSCLLNYLQTGLNIFILKTHLSQSPHSSTHLAPG